MVVKYIKLFLILVLPMHSLAQVKAIPLSYWVDDYNLRIHTSYYLLGNTIHDAQRYMAGSAGFDLAGIFRYKAVIPNAHKTVRVECLRCNNVTGLNLRSAAKLAGHLDTIIEEAARENVQWLRYDDSGYLLSRVIEKYNPDPLYTSRDTFLFQYNKGDDGSLKVKMTVRKIAVNRNKTPKKEYGYFYASIYCGEIKKGPFVLSSEGYETYDFDAKGRITAISYHYSGYANQCPDYDANNDANKVFKYDAKGRLLSIIETATLTGQIKNRETFKYKDVRKETIPLFGTPLMQQYLSTIDKPVFAEVDYAWQYWGRPDGKTYFPIDSPQGNKERYITMRNSKNELCLSVQIGADGKPGLPIIYSSGRDSTGDYRMLAQVYAHESDTERAMYDPGIEPVERTIRSGCVVSSYYERPPGTWMLSDYDCTDRKEKEEAGWKLIAYAPYGSRSMGGGYLAPGYYSGCGLSGGMNNFALIGPDGDMRYVYDDGFIYRMTYE